MNPQKLVSMGAALSLVFGSMLACEEQPVNSLDCTDGVTDSQSTKCVPDTATPTPGYASSLVPANEIHDPDPEISLSYYYNDGYTGVGVRIEINRPHLLCVYADAFGFDEYVDSPVPLAVWEPLGDCPMESYCADDGWCGGTFAVDQDTTLRYEVITSKDEKINTVARAAAALGVSMVDAVAAWKWIEHGFDKEAALEDIEGTLYATSAVEIDYYADGDAPNGGAYGVRAQTTWPLRDLGWQQPLTTTRH